MRHITTVTIIITVTITNIITITFNQQSAESTFQEVFRKTVKGSRTTTRLHF